MKKTRGYGTCKMSVLFIIYYLILGGLNNVTDKWQHIKNLNYHTVFNEREFMWPKQLEQKYVTTLAPRNSPLYLEWILFNLCVKECVVFWSTTTVTFLGFYDENVLTQRHTTPLITAGLLRKQARGSYGRMKGKEEGRSDVSSHFKWDWDLKNLWIKVFDNRITRHWLANQMH